MGRLLRLHFVARRGENDAKLRRRGDGRWESGNWKVAARIADEAIGAEIHLHERQGARSWVAGRIDGWSWDEVETGRVVFLFTRDDALCRPEPDGWGHGAEKRYVRG